MSQRTKSITLLLVTLIAVSGCMGASSRGEEATPTPIPTPIVPAKPTYEVRRGEVVKTLEFTGRIAPVIEEELFFRTSGYVDAIYVDRDEWVQAGDILAELEVTDLKHQLAQAEAALESARSNHELGTAEAEAALRIAELRLAIAKADDPTTTVLIAKADLQVAEIALQNAQAAYDKIAWKPGASASFQAMDLWQAGAAYEKAEAQHQQALQACQIHYHNIEIQEQEVALARLRLEQLKSGLDIKEMQVTVERLKAQLEDARLVAPFDGKLLSLSLTEGRAVDAHKPVLVVGDLSELEVSAALLGSEMNELEEGMPVTCMISDRPGEEIKGHIRRLPYPYGGGGRVSDVEDEDESTRVALETSASAPGLEVGDLVRVTVVLERKADVLWLPPQAIRTFEGRKFVVVQEGEGQRRVDIKLGIESEDRVEIEEGLTEGQIVIGQ